MEEGLETYKIFEEKCSSEPNQFVEQYFFFLIYAHVMLANWKYIPEAQLFLDEIKREEKFAMAQCTEFFYQCFAVYEARSFYYGRKYKTAIEMFGNFLKIFERKKEDYHTNKHFVKYLYCYGHLKDWQTIVIKSNNIDNPHVLVNIEEEYIGYVLKILLLRGWALCRLKKYSEALVCFNKVLNNSSVETETEAEKSAALLLKMYTAYERGQFKAYWKFLSKMVKEHKTMKSLLKSLQKTVRKTCPYLVNEWPKIMYLTAPAVREDMPYTKSELQGFQLYRSSSVIQLHFVSKEYDEKESEAKDKLTIKPGSKPGILTVQKLDFKKSNEETYDFT